MQTLSDTSLKARKDHRCDWCGIVIPKGQTYRRASLKYDDLLYTWKSHAVCDGLITKLKMDSDHDGISQDDFMEYVKNEYQDIFHHNFSDYYESKDFKYPNWSGIIEFVTEFHKGQI